jgi:hypothetical protein
MAVFSGRLPPLLAMMRSRVVAAVSLSVALCTAGTAASVQAAAAAHHAVPVLGSKQFAPHGAGFGHAHPAHIFNGGDPSGDIVHVSWKHWGADRSTGRGKTYIFKPGGGYYNRPVRIQLRAQALGQCPGNARPAYTKLYFREPSKPGGKLGRWHAWSGQKTICHGVG